VVRHNEEVVADSAASEATGSLFSPVASCYMALQLKLQTLCRLTGTKEAACDSTGSLYWFR
jgi:hypothetical protein